MTEFKVVTSRGPVLCAASSWQEARKLIKGDGYEVLAVFEQCGLGHWCEVWCA